MAKIKSKNSTNRHTDSTRSVFTDKCARKCKAISSYRCNCRRSKQRLPIDISEDHHDLLLQSAANHHLPQDSRDQSIISLKDGGCK